MSKARLSGWHACEESWEEAVLSWGEQVERPLLHRHRQGETLVQRRRLWGPTPDHEEIEAAQQSPERDALPPDQ